MKVNHDFFAVLWWKCWLRGKETICKFEEVSPKGQHVKPKLSRGVKATRTNHHQDHHLWRKASCKGLQPPSKATNPKWGHRFSNPRKVITMSTTCLSIRRKQGRRVQAKTCKTIGVRRVMMQNVTRHLLFRTPSSSCHIFHLRSRTSSTACAIANRKAGPLINSHLRVGNR